MARQPDLFDGTPWAPPVMDYPECPGMQDILTKDEWARYGRHWRLLPLHLPSGPKVQPID